VKRPPAKWTSALKRKQLPAGAKMRDWSEDHQMPIELGGAPKDEANLRPVPVARAKADDRVENRLHRELCAGTISLVQAQQEMSRTKADEGGK